MSVLVLCRFLNMVIYLLVLTAYFVRSNDLWASIGAGIRIKRLGIGLVFLFISIGSANAYVQHIPPSWPVPCFTVAGALVLLGIWLSRGRHDPHH